LGKIRVIKLYIGGGFGNKQEVIVEHLTAAMSAEGKELMNWDEKKKNIKIKVEIREEDLVWHVLVICQVIILYLWK
jgi:CO/xanthine dehydrogenase Mo-binding subunit